MPDDVIEFPDLRNEVAVITVDSNLDGLVGEESGPRGDDGTGLDVWAIMEIAVMATRSGSDGVSPNFSPVDDVITVDGDGERINHDLFDKAAAFAGAVATEQGAEIGKAVTVAYHFPGDFELGPDHLTETPKKDAKSNGPEVLVTKRAIQRLHFAMYGRQDSPEVSWDEIHALALVVDRVARQNGGGVTPEDAVKIFTYNMNQAPHTQTAEFLNRYIDALVREFEIDLD